MKTHAVVLHHPEKLAVDQLELSEPGEDDAVVDIRWSGISTGTERLLWSGRMPSFPGMGYPLVPGYESVGRVTEAGAGSGLDVGQTVFAPGAQCFGEVRGLFGGSASRLVVPSRRLVPIDETLGESGVLLALAATAYHATHAKQCALPELIVGHGVLARIIARLTLVAGDTPPVVWETDRSRHSGAAGYEVVHPEDDDRHDYRTIFDASGDASLLDQLISRLAPGGEVVLAGFYDQPLAFSFPPAFMREARIRVAAEWKPDDLMAVRDLVDSGQLSLSDLISERQSAGSAESAYKTAFEDPSCLKMILDWSEFS